MKLFADIRRMVVAVRTGISTFARQALASSPTQMWFSTMEVLKIFCRSKGLRLDRHHFFAISCAHGRSDETVGFKHQTDWTTVPSGMKLGWLA